MNIYLIRTISTIIIGSLISGCASRSIYFSSSPAGALVSAGGASCTTPCDLKVPVKTSTAIFTLPSGERKEVPIDHLTKRNAETRYKLAKAGEYTLGTLAIPLLVIGGVTALITGILYESDTIETEHSSRDRDLFLIVGGTLVAGGLLVYASKEMAEDANERRPEIDVLFQRPTPESPTGQQLPFGTLKNGPLKLYPDEIPTINNLK